MREESLLEEKVRFIAMRRRMMEWIMCGVVYVRIQFKANVGLTSLETMST